MNKGAYKLSYGQSDIAYNIYFAQRKTLEIAVHPDCSVVIKAPTNATLAKIQERVEKRSRWIKRQIDYFKQFDPRVSPREYVSGESHLYLGRQYRLKIKKGPSRLVHLSRGFFNLTHTNDPTPIEVKEILDKWYRQKAEEKFFEIFESEWHKFQKFSSKKPNLKIRKMKSRWGSLSHRNTLTLNIDLIRAPRECIEYVIAHELCHIVHNHHGSDFYKLLDKILPDWSKRKHKLEMALK